MRKIKLTRYEKKIEKDLLAGVYKPVSKEKFDEVVQAIAQRRKDAVLNIRVNSYDLEAIKKKAARAGVPYQTYISEFLHQLAA